MYVKGRVLKCPKIDILYILPYIPKYICNVIIVILSARYRIKESECFAIESLSF